MTREDFHTFHIIGICGIGMSAIAQLLKSSGYSVQGSDVSPGYMRDFLQSNNIKVFIEHKAKNIENADVIIRSTAVSDDNIEIIAAKDQKKTILSRCEILKKALKDKYVIAISGCHGKTTTTTMIGEIFTDAGLDPTIICGGIMRRFKNNVRIGKSDIYIIEADESDNTFNIINKDCAVLTNIGLDHLDFYGTRDELHRKFLEFIISSKRKSIVPNDVKTLQVSQASQASQIEDHLIFYDFNKEKQQTKITNIVSKENSWQTSFDYEIASNIYQFIVNAPGEHNVYNAAAAISCAVSHNIEVKTIKSTLQNFLGVERRLSLIGEFMGNKIIDDYAHHPDEIIAGLKTMKGISNNVIAVIQPHRYTRVKEFFDQYINAFQYAETVILLNVYPAGEKDNGFNSQKLYDFCIEKGINNITLINSFDTSNKFNQIKQKIIDINQNNGLVVFMGAGDITHLALSLVRKCKLR